jgi:competence protein ComGC
MKTQISKQRNQAMTLIEVFAVIVVVFILATIFLPVIRTPHSGAQRINCINNLKQVGLAFRIWEGDNNDLYPAAVSITNGGTMELVATGDAAAVFQVMSNELSTPKILACPDDKTINSFAAGFSSAELKNKISYFAGLDATNDSNPNLLLSGDYNFEIGGIPVKSGLLSFSTNSSIAWSAARHKSLNAHFWTPKRDRFVGNICLADGSVSYLWHSDELQKAIFQTGLATNHFTIP